MVAFVVGFMLGLPLPAAFLAFARQVPFLYIAIVSTGSLVCLSWGRVVGIFASGRSVCHRGDTLPPSVYECQKLGIT